MTEASKVQNILSQQNIEIIALKKRNAELETALRNIIDGWDWWLDDQYDRESPHDEIEDARVVLAVGEQ